MPCLILAQDGNQKTADLTKSTFKMLDRFGQEYKPRKESLMRNSPNGQNPNCMVCGHFTLHFLDMEDDTDTGFDDLDAALALSRRTVACNVFRDISALILSSAPQGEVLIEVQPSVSDNSDRLAEASGMHALSTPSAFIDNGIWTTLQTGVDAWANLNNLGFQDNPHGTLLVNFDSARPYAYNDLVPDLVIGPNERDFYSIVLHEGLHALGIYSLINGEEPGRESYFLETNGVGEHLYSRYDRFLQSGTIPLINYTSPFDIAPNTTVPLAFACPALSGTDPIFFNGTWTAAGQTVYTQNPWWDSNLSHLNCQSSGTMLGNGYTMNPFYFTGTTQRHPHINEVAILCDLGYTISDTYGTMDPGTTGSNVPFMVYNNACQGTLLCTKIGVNDIYEGAQAVESGNSILIEATNGTDGYLDNDINFGMASVLTMDNLFWDPSQGNVSIATNGDITFSSNPGFSGYANIQYIPTCSLFGANETPGNITFILVEVNLPFLDECVGDCLDNGNIACYGDLEDFQIFFQSSSPPNSVQFFQIPYPHFEVNNKQNTPDICNGVYLQSNPDEYFILPFNHPVAPGCELNISYEAGFRSWGQSPPNAVGVRFYGSEFYPCESSNGISNIFDAQTTVPGNVGTMTCNDGTIFEPWLMSFQVFDQSTLNPSVWCTANPVLASNSFTWVNNTGNPVNFLLVRGAVGGGFALFDNIEVTSSDCPPSEVTITPSVISKDVCPGEITIIDFQICNDSPNIVDVDYSVDLIGGFSNIFIQANAWFDNMGQAVSPISIAVSPACETVSLEFLSTVQDGNTATIDFTLDAFDGCVNGNSTTAVTNNGAACGDVFLDANILLEGPEKLINGTDVTMEKVPTLLIPSTGPYPALMYPQYGNQLDNFFNNAVTNSEVIDWVFVELRDEVDPTIVHYTRNALLMADGRIVEFDEASATPNLPLSLSFQGVVLGNYFVAIRHRNHLDIMTDSPLQFTDGNITTVDFISGSHAANSMKMITATQYELYSGDLTNDNYITAADRSAAWNARNTVGYRVSDSSLNGITDVDERTFTWNNRNLSGNLPQ